MTIKPLHPLICLSLWVAISGSTTANAGTSPAETADECLLRTLRSASELATVSELRKSCEQSPAVPSSDAVIASEHADVAPSQTEKPVGQGLAKKEINGNESSLLKAYRTNYLLPFVYTTSPNNLSYPQGHGDLQHTEIQFQLSLKMFEFEDIRGSGFDLAFAYTGHSFWQAYNHELSAPFRETDHEPEILLTRKNGWEKFGVTNSLNELVLNHQSNGRGGELSRSWNRVMLNSVWKTDNFIFSLKPWYRIPESKKDLPTDSDGDDNPDIVSYLGNFELRGEYLIQENHSIGVMLRNNLRSDNHGAVELTYNFPILDSKRLMFFLKYFNGYGESLIDYDHRIQSLGIGFSINDGLGL